MKLFQGIFCLLLVISCDCLYIYLQGTSQQCYLMSVFREERLLIEIEIPVVYYFDRIVLRVRTGNETVIRREIINQAKITVLDGPTNYVTNQNSLEQMQYETCLSIIDVSKQTNIPDVNLDEQMQDGDTTDEIKDQQEQNIKDQSQQDVSDKRQETIRPEGYMLQLKLMTNFQHRIRNTIQSTTDLNYKNIAKISAAMDKINEEQISLHQIHQTKEKDTQDYLRSLKSKVIIYSIIQMLMILTFTVLQLRLLRGYLSSMSVI